MQETCTVIVVLCNTCLAIFNTQDNMEIGPGMELIRLSRGPVPDA